MRVTSGSSSRWNQVQSGAANEMMRGVASSTTQEIVAFGIARRRHNRLLGIWPPHADASREGFLAVAINDRGECLAMPIYEIRLIPDETRLVATHHLECADDSEASSRLLEMACAGVSEVRESNRLVRLIYKPVSSHYDGVDGQPISAVTSSGQLAGAPRIIGKNSSFP